MRFNDYINDLLRQGKSSFTIQQAQHAMGKSPRAIYSSIDHLLTKNKCNRSGPPPLKWYECPSFAPDLMKIAQNHPHPA